MAALVAFVVAAVVMIALAFSAAASVAIAHERVAERLRTGAPMLKRWGGVVLIVLGVWFVLLGIFADVFADVFPV